MSSPALVSQVLTHSYRFYDGSVKGRRDVDEKANWFLALTGVSISILFTVVNLLLVKIKGQIVWPVLFYVACGSCLLLLFAGAVLFFVAFRARTDYRTVSEQDILNATALEETEKEREGNTTVYYDRYFTAHLLDIGLVNLLVNERKGAWLKRGQVAFIGGLFFLIIVSGILTYSLINYKEVAVAGDVNQKPAPTTPVVAPKPVKQAIVKPPITNKHSGGRMVTAGTKGDGDSSGLRPKKEKQ